MKDLSPISPPDPNQYSRYELLNEAHSRDANFLKNTIIDWGIMGVSLLGAYVAINANVDLGIHAVGLALISGLITASAVVVRAAQKSRFMHKHGLDENTVSQELDDTKAALGATKIIDNEK